MGTPRNGPSGRSPAASVRAASKRSRITALSCGLTRSMRSIAASTSSLGLTSPRRTRSTRPVASIHVVSVTLRTVAVDPDTTAAAVPRPSQGRPTAHCQDVRVTGTAALDEFQEQRSRLFGIAYRMLGSASDAEDVLQDAWLRWQGADHARVADAGAFLARTVTNLCLNALTSARARREVYVGPWLPEPVFTGGSDGPLEKAVQQESVSFALLALLERLSPAERAAYVLREAFAYSPREVAEVIGTTETNVRQLHSRARRHVGTAASREVEPAQWHDLIARFLLAARDGDVAGLEALLA